MSHASPQINIHLLGQINNDVIEHSFSDDALESSNAGAHVPNIDPPLNNALAEAPFNVTGIPEHMQVDDTYAQMVINEAIMCSTHPDAADPDFTVEFRNTVL
ncbi:hypothetical protein JVT61DRAFT_12159 [Boletus reticuloceps]|uniref:Uncharacterized protein n=1 Tax=Boletus reticuloceps TaxID=495285 RepID=A0A8I3A3Z9_9AGAM|nr:hypothetical protein JVT61DRAFT_12159 [Boletus reticuloceps]